jgi:hypothetical protein
MLNPVYREECMRFLLLQAASGDILPPSTKERTFEVFKKIKFFALGR